MSVIAITGVSGYLGRRLVARLEREPSVERVVGIDVAHPQGSPKLDFHEIDVADPNLAKALVGVDTVVHLAFIHDPIKDPARMRRVNVDGTRTVLEAAATVGARAFVYPSSAMVYGAHRDNPLPLPETASLRANADNIYATHKLETEQLLKDFKVLHPAIPVAVLRFAIVLGPNVENFVSRMFQAPRLFSVRGFEPPFQCVHEEDVASALQFAIARELDGVFNVSADGWLAAGEVARLTGKRRLELPESVAMSMADRLWRTGLTAAPPAELQFLMHPWVVDNAAMRAQGWAPRYSNREALLEMMETARSYIAIGRTRLRKESLAKGAAATLGAVGTMALVRRRRRQS